MIIYNEVDIQAFARDVYSDVVKFVPLMFFFCVGIVSKVPLVGMDYAGSGVGDAESVSGSV